MNSFDQENWSICTARCYFPENSTMKINSAEKFFEIIEILTKTATKFLKNLISVRTQKIKIILYNIIYASGYLRNNTSEG